MKKKILLFLLVIFLNFIFLASASKGGNTPQYGTGNQTDTTLAGQPALFSLNWTDNVGLSGYIFETNNSGTPTNDTWTVLGINPDINNINLTGYWAMDWYNSSGIFDNSTYNNFGKFQGVNFGILNITTGKVGNALNFDGVDDDINVPDSPGLRLVNNFTVEFWMKPFDLTAVNDYILCKCGGGTTNDWTVIWEWVGNSVEFFAQGFTGTNPRTGSAISLPDANWHHIVYTYNSSQWEGYRDGSLIFSVARTFALRSASSTWLTIGSPFSASGFFYRGMLDEVAIYNRSFTATEIKSHYLLFNNSWSNVTKTLNSTIGANVQWRVYANDTSNNWNASETYNLTTTSGVSISDCGTLSTENTTYVLTTNVSSTQTCFKVSANNVTLDCQGYIINYTTGTKAGYAVNNTDGYDNITIKNCNIVLGNRSVSNAYAIYAVGMLNSTIQNNTINTTGSFYGHGIYLDSSDNNTLSNNTINATGSDAYGIYLYLSSDYNILSNNTIRITGGFSYGIYLVFGSSSNTLSNNTIEITGSSSYGIYVAGSNGNTISNNTVKTTRSSASGIFLSTANSNALSNNVINTTGSDAYGIYVGGSSNALSNNTIRTTGSSGHGTYFESSNNNTVSDNIISASGSSGIGIYLYYSYANNITRGSITSRLSNDYYLESAGTTNNFTNTNFTVSRKIYFFDSDSWFNYNNKTDAQLWLKTNVSSAVTITRRLVSWAQSLMQWSDTSDIEITANYNVTGLFANEYYFVYNNSVLTYTLQADSSGNLPSFTVDLLSDEQEIKVVKISPQWSNQNSNATTIKAGDPVLLYTYWTDNANLSYAILATNEIGIWQNKTTYGSPLTLSGNESWSNFTWQNNSIKTAKTITWKIYTNDTYNNWNITDEKTFTINPNIIITIKSNKMIKGVEILSRPNSNIEINGSAFYEADNSTYANKSINFTYDSRGLGSNTTDSSGDYQFTFSIPYEGLYNLTVSARDSYNNTGQNVSILRIATHPTDVRFRISYRIGSTKTNDVYRIGTPSLTSETIDDLNLMNIQYANNLTYGYVCTHDQTEYSNGLSISLIHSGKKADLSFVNFSTNSTSTNYILELKQKIENDNLLLTYTKGNCQGIHDKMYLVERYEIPSRPFSSFSYPIPEGILILIQFKDDRIQINGSDRFSAGDYKLCVEKSGISPGNKPIIDVRIC